MPTPTGTLGIQVHVPINAEDERGIDSESLTADRVSPDTFRLRNSPFFAFDLSAGDTVRAEKNAEGEWHFREVVVRSGHSTYRIYLEDGRDISDPDVEQRLQPIVALGASFESANGRFFAVDIPPAANINAIYDLFEQGETDGIWEFEEAHYEPATPTP